MKQKRILGSLAVLLVFLATLQATARRRVPSSLRVEPGPSRQVAVAPVPVLVELFTSEGCSSCPLADALLERLAAQQPISGVEVIALEEHVDYWNHLGWNDPFSASKFSARQESYAYSLHSGTVYTPQMVVDGQLEFVGNHEGKARDAITQAARTVKTPVRLAVAPTNGASPSLQIQVGRLTGSGRADKAEVFVAVTEAGLHTAVTAGENAGQTLRHSPVARMLRKLGEAQAAGDAAFSASLPLQLDPSWKLQNLRAVVLVQEHKSRKILGVASISLQ